MEVLVLGHTGMLGTTVVKYFEQVGYHVKVLPAAARWPSEEMETAIKESDASWVINCIGAIPQRKPRDHEYFDLNTRLPLFLFSIKSKKIIHAATDCEFSGKISPDECYSIDDPLDATDLYGISKAIPAEFVKHSEIENVKVLRCSIVGFEQNTNFSLLNWFLSSADKGNVIKGYNNHYWNGITTLEWAKLADGIIKEEFTGQIFQAASEKVSKYQLLKVMADVFRPGYEVIENAHEKYQNKCLAPNLPIRNIRVLLQDLKDFYN